jgi:translation initiation factor IF-2
MGLTPDDWDGDTMVIPVSAREQLGIDDLLEAILLLSEEIRPRANPDAAPTGTVLEARIEKGRGVVATLLVQNGTLRTGDTLLIGANYGRVKAMFDFRGKAIGQAGPSTPVSVAGLNGMPQAGDQFRVVENERTARKIVAELIAESPDALAVQRPSTLEEFFTRLQEGDTKTLYLVIKADVQGSLEPIVNSVEKLATDEVEIEILRASTGNISESDIMLASASDAIVLGFNVDVDPIARAAANNEQVDIRFYDIIYKLIEDIEKALKGMLAPTYEDVVIGRAEVREVFRIRGVGNIAGSYLRSGVARRNAKVHVVRNGRLLHTGTIASLKHLQENVREVKAGFEFGVSVEGFEDFQPGDIIEFFTTQQVEVA